MKLFAYFICKVNIFNNMQHFLALTFFTFLKIYLETDIPQKSDACAYKTFNNKFNSASVFIL